MKILDFRQPRAELQCPESRTVILAIGANIFQ